jgi:hypothetical protein
MSEIPADYIVNGRAGTRTNSIKIRVSDDELAVLHMNRKRAELARWMREVCLSAGQGDLIDEMMPPTVDPALLRQLSGLGNLMNQIARALHGRDIDPSNRIKALASLVKMEADLAAIREEFTAK